MPILIGACLAAGVAVFARVVGFDRDRVLYPLILVVIASYYLLFAVMVGAEVQGLIEASIFAVFAIAAVAGFRLNLWFVVGGLALHGLFDAFHNDFIGSEGVPRWWPMFCLGYDVAAAAALTMLILFRTGTRESFSRALEPRR